MLNLDTHILIYALIGELSKKEKQLLSSSRWSISAIVLWEIAKLAQLGRIGIDLDERQLIQSLSSLQIWPISIDICRIIRKLDFRADPADELIAATSVVYKIPLLTRDKVIRRSKIVPFASKRA